MYGASVDDRGSKGDCTPLMEASSVGDRRVVQLLCEKGADVNAKSLTGNEHGQRILIIIIHLATQLKLQELWFIIYGYINFLAIHFPIFWPRVVL